ncbi:MAG: hypothetical protein KDI67_07455 [Gammaproteobacteria bacterium]|nr:hypothetical protein [Gammaproteobacteria bacterium]
MAEQLLCFDQVHIDVARNSTDDFNPFHDPQRWQNIRGNPFASPIALGFQMEFLAADRVARHRRSNAEDTLIAEHALHFSNYEFHFADALRVGEAFSVTVKNTIDKSAQGGGLSNRIVLRKAAGDLVLMGTQSETAEPRFLPDAVIEGLPSLEHLPDRAMAPGTPYFRKRKFLNTSNGKNFAVGALCDQHDYFDELSERVDFPPLFTASMVSCALLEKGWAHGHDFEADALVYTSHQISVDNRLQRKLRSNDMLNILVEGPLTPPPPKGLGCASVDQQLYRCLGVLHGRQILFRANVQLAPLRSFLGKH